MNVSLTQLEHAYLSAVAAFNNSQYDQAIAQFTALKHQLPAHPGCDFYIGQNHFWSGQYEKAQTHLETALSLSPELPEIHYQLGCTHLYLGHFSVAMKYFMNTVSRQPANINTYRLLALSAIKADLEFDVQLPENPDSELALAFSDGLTDLGDTYLCIQAYAIAIRFLEQALHLNPANTHAWVKRWLIKQATWDWSTWEADLAALVTLIQQSPENTASVIPEFQLLTIAIPQTLKHQQLIQSARYYQRQFEELAGPFIPNVIPARSKIRLGYLSGQFNHSIQGYTNLKMLPHHSDQFEIVFYDIGLNDGSAMAQDMYKLAHHRLDLGRSTPRESIARIRADQPDILIDNQIYVGYNRPDISECQSNISAARLFRALVCSRQSAAEQSDPKISRPSRNRDRLRRLSQSLQNRA